jgi:hypothetical protein
MHNTASGEYATGPAFMMAVFKTGKQRVNYLTLLCADNASCLPAPFMCGDLAIIDIVLLHMALQ